MSASGQYVTATLFVSTGGGVIYSSNYGQTWAQSASITTVYTWSCAMSASGQYQIVGSFSSGTSPNLVFNSSSWTAPVVDATHNAASFYQVYFEASTAQTGTYVAATNTFIYAYNPLAQTTTATNANSAATAVGVYGTSVSTGKITAATGSYTWVKMWVRAGNGDGYSAWVSQTG